MKNGWDDILRFIFNLVTVLAILGVLSVSYTHLTLPTT